MSRSRVDAGLILLMVVVCGCTRTVYVPEGGAVQDGKYDTPVSNAGADVAIQKAFAAIHFLNSVAFYKEVVFLPDSGVRTADLRDRKTEKLAVSTQMYHRTASGTGTTILRTPSRIAIVTSAHVVNFPDSVVTYYEIDGKPSTVRSLSVKVRQNNYVPDIPGADRMEVLALDEGRDVALLGQMIPDLPAGSVSELEFPVGTVDDLQWGSLVYVFGFPAGTRMMTTGLVSKMPRNRRSAFMTDAAFNRGFSGGLVLAIRDGAPNFEWVGIATSGAAATEITVEPPDIVPVRTEDLDQVYEGPLILRQKKRLRYGITTCTSVDVIVEFLRDNAAELSRAGYHINLTRRGRPQR